MKRYRFSLIFSLFLSIFLLGCAKSFVGTTRNRVANYWLLDSKEYRDYDAYTGEYLGSETLVFQGDSHYDFGVDGYYDGVEILNSSVTKVGGNYTIIDGRTIIMDYDGYNDQEVNVDILNSGTMQLTLTYEQNGISTDETLYFYR